MKSDATACESRDILSRRWLVFTLYWLPAIAMLAVGPLAISNALSTSHGVIALWCLPEMFLGRYRKSRADDGNAQSEDVQ